MTKAEDLLRQVVDHVDDPWFHEAYEGFNDCCMFCGSQDEEMSEWKDQVQIRPFMYWHKTTCLWFTIHEYLGLEVHPFHGRR